MRKILDILTRWLPLAVITTLSFTFIYIAVQQNIRMAANDPQIQITQDAAKLLSDDSASPQSITESTNQIDISQSIGTFIIVFDDSGKPLSTSGKLNNEAPTPPSGVFEFTRQHEDDRFTWQPQKRVRIAAVIKHFTGKQSGFILAGRSLKEVEKREKRLLIEITAGYAITLLLSLIAVVLTNWISSRLMRKAEN